MIITPRRIASAGQDVGRNIIDVCSGLHVLDCWPSKLEECLFKMRLANHVIRKELRKIVWDGFWVSYEICTQKLATFSISIFYWKGLQNEGEKKRRRTYKIIIQWAQIITNVKLITKKLEHDLKKKKKNKELQLDMDGLISQKYVINILDELPSFTRWWWLLDGSQEPLCRKGNVLFAKLPFHNHLHETPINRKVIKIPGKRVTFDYSWGFTHSVTRWAGNNL